MRNFIKAIINDWKNVFTEDFAARFTMPEKKNFREWLKKEWYKQYKENLEEQSFSKWKLCKGTNIYRKAPNEKVILMAHYDTPCSLPFLFVALTRHIGINHYVPICICLCIIIELLACIYRIWFVGEGIIYIGEGLLLFCLWSFIKLSNMISLFKNPVNLNDNSSGIITIVCIMQYIQLLNPKFLHYVSVLFTDNEEKYLLGSKHYFKNHMTGNALIINIDGVGLGDYLHWSKGEDCCPKAIIMLYEKLTKERVFDNVHIIDQHTFRLTSDFSVVQDRNAMSFTFLEKAKYWNGYYGANMHSPEDNELDEKKMEHFIIAMAKFIIDYLERSYNPSRNDASNP